MPAELRIELFPADLVASLDFYRRLGFATVGGPAGEPPYASLRLDAVRIGLCQSDPVDPHLRGVPAGTEIVIEVDDIDRAHDQVTAAGIDPVEGLQRRPWGLTDFRVTDPDGYYLRFTDRRSSTS